MLSQNSAQQSGMFVMPLPMVMLFSERQLCSTLSPVSVTPSGMTMLVSPQFSNAWGPMYSNDSGSVMLFREDSPANAYSSMRFKALFSAKVTACKEEQPLNVPGSIVVIAAGSVIS